MPSPDRSLCSGAPLKTPPGCESRPWVSIALSGTEPIPRPPPHPTPPTPSPTRFRCLGSHSVLLTVDFPVDGMMMHGSFTHNLSPTACALWVLHVIRDLDENRLGGPLPVQWSALSNLERM